MNTFLTTAMYLVGLVALYMLTNLLLGYLALPAGFGTLIAILFGIAALAIIWNAVASLIGATPLTFRR